MNPIQILYEDSFILIINKPAGLLSQNDRNGSGSILEILSQKYNKSLHILTRLDRPVSGCLLLAKTPESAALFSELLKIRQIQKIYFAAVEKMPPMLSGTLINQLSRKNLKAVIAKSAPGLSAKTHFRYIGKSSHYHFLELNPETGRFHQLRVQLSAMGCPIKGDVKYGARRANKDRTIHLHAGKIAFDHPFSGTHIEVNAPFANDPVWNALQQILSGGGDQRENLSF